MEMSGRFVQWRLARGAVDELQDNPTLEAPTAPRVHLSQMETIPPELLHHNSPRALTRAQ